MNELDSKLRQGKKKIFKEDNKNNKMKIQQHVPPYKSKIEHLQHSQINNFNKDQLQNSIKGAFQSQNQNVSLAQKRRQNDLSTRLTQMKTQLKQQQNRYDKLFQQYQDLVQKNNLIQKQYIKLKYQHNKQLKQIKTILKQSINNLIKQCDELFKQFIYQNYQNKLKKDNINNNNNNQINRGQIQKIKDKIIMYINQFQKHNFKQNIYNRHQQRNSNNHNQVRRHKFIDKDKFDNHQNQNTVKIQHKHRHHNHQNKQAQHAHHQDKSIFQKIVGSPWKDKEAGGAGGQQKVNTSLQNTNKEILLEDQYYGQLQDYQFYEQKIMARKNYQLMKSNRFSSQNNLDIRRKKIFHLNQQT